MKTLHLRSGLLVEFLEGPIRLVFVRVNVAVVIKLGQEVQWDGERQRL